MRAVGIIPARFASTRFPGKPLVDLGGKPLIQWTWEAAKRCRRLEQVLIATDDDRIAAAVRGFGGGVVMTRADHPSGTDRLAEVARGLDAEIIVNIQGDEPFINPATIDAVVQPFDTAPSHIMMTTACVTTTDASEAADPNVVKAVVTAGGRALYFSRHPIPYLRDAGNGPVTYRLHLGLYAYRREFLLQFASWPPTPLEKAESLEQLRALEHGAGIHVVDVPERALGIDTPADLDRAKRMMNDER
ncbi:MAG TPA: 3-deoxy-manno-octulosonate cytidylyltransferase [Armatimonadota bacterium]